MGYRPTNPSAPSAPLREKSFISLVTPTWTWGSHFPASLEAGSRIELGRQNGKHLSSKTRFGVTLVTFQITAHANRPFSSAGMPTPTARAYPAANRRIRASTLASANIARIRINTIAPNNSENPIKVSPSGHSKGPSMALPPVVMLAG
jgi:hypothetical protein